jgi:hypothetical protein
MRIAFVNIYDADWLCWTFGSELSCLFEEKRAENIKQQL